MIIFSLNKKKDEHKNEKNPKVPLKTIKKYLELEGIKLDDED